jgi:hypothetical protein
MSKKLATKYQDMVGKTYKSTATGDEITITAVRRLLLGQKAISKEYQTELHVVGTMRPECDAAKLAGSLGYPYRLFVMNFRKVTK